MTNQVKGWSTSASGNNVSGGLFQENLAPNETTDNLRQAQAAIRTQWNDSEWFVFGDGDGAANFSFLSSTQFRVDGASVASTYHVGRRVRATGPSTGEIYGSITAVAVNGGSTDVTVVWDGSVLQNDAFEIAIASMSAEESSHPARVPHAVSFLGAVDFTNGPFTLKNITERQTGSESVPSTTKRLVINAYGAGGGGSRSGADFGDSPLQAGDPGNGQTLTITGGAFSLTVGGGRRGGGLVTPFDMNNIVSPVVTGATFSWDLIGGGMVGGAGGQYAHTGNNGDFVQAVIDNPAFTSLTLSGGEAGIGATGGSNGEGVAGLRARAVFFFYE